MPQIQNQNVIIHYKQLGQGPALVCIHGFSGNLTSWTTTGFDTLADAYQLILIDLRGHGASSKPHDPAAYAFPDMASDIVAVLDATNIERAHYLGYSLGGDLGFELLRLAPQRVRSLLVGGASPYNQQTAADLDFLIDLYQRGVTDGVQAILAGFAEWGALSPAREARLRAADLRAQLALLLWYRAHIPSYAADLPTVTIPCLLFAGGLDEPYYTDSQNAVAEIPNAIFVGLPGLKHGDAAAASDLLVPQFRKFLSKVP